MLDTPLFLDAPPTVLAIARAAGLEVSIEAGDFISCTLRPFLCGFVSQVQQLRLNRHMSLTAYTVELPDGHSDTIYGPSARLVALSDRHETQIITSPAFQAVVVRRQAETQE